MVTIDAKKEILAFAGIAFILLGVLFGMNIMTFIFGNLGPTQAGLAPGTTAFNVSTSVQNNSLEGINTYASQSGTQFNVVSITIILALLVAVFALFWRVFMGTAGKGGSGGNFG